MKKDFETALETTHQLLDLTLNYAYEAVENRSYALADNYGKGIPVSVVETIISGMMAAFDSSKTYSK